MIHEYKWQPGNATNYHLLYGKIKTEPERYLLCWQRKGGSGGNSFLWEKQYLHWTYLSEKLDVNEADANGILLFLQKHGHDVGFCKSEQLSRMQPTYTDEELTTLEEMNDVDNCDDFGEPIEKTSHLKLVTKETKE